MADGVGTVLVDPRIKGSDIHIAYLFTLPSHSMQSHRACSPSKEGLAGFQGGYEIEGAQKTLDRLIRVDQLVPFALPHFDDCVTHWIEWLHTILLRFCLVQHNAWLAYWHNSGDNHDRDNHGTRRRYRSR